MGPNERRTKMVCCSLKLKLLIATIPLLLALASQIYLVESCDGCGGGGYGRGGGGCGYKDKGCGYKDKGCGYKDKCHKKEKDCCPKYEKHYYKKEKKDCCECEKEKCHKKEKSCCRSIESPNVHQSAPPVRYVEVPVRRKQRLIYDDYDDDELQKVRRGRTAPKHIPNYYREVQQPQETVRRERHPSRLVRLIDAIRDK